MLRRLPVRLAILLVVLAGSPLPAADAPSDVRLRDYIHTTWTHFDGVPLVSVEKILQTPDGYLWLVTREALLRFDGMRFVRPPTPCTQRVTHMAPAFDGGFWAACGEKVIRRTVAGQFVEVPGLPQGGRASGLLDDRNGRLWLIGNTIRYLNVDGTEGRAFASPVGSAFFVAAQDSGGTIWAADPKGLYHLYPDRVELVSPTGFFCLAPARDGGVFASNGTRVLRLRKGAAPEPVVDFPTSTFQNCMRQVADDDLWIAARPNGIARLHDGRIERLPDTAPLDRLVMDLLADREGAIWVAAIGGLHRFRRPTIRHLRLSPAHDLPHLVFVDSQDRLWASSTVDLSVQSLHDLSGRAVTFKDNYFAVGEDEGGRIWLSDEKAIGYVASGAFVAVADAAGNPVTNVDAFARDESGHLWALARRIGVYQVTPGPPRLVAPSPHAAIRFLVSQRSGIWIGLTQGGLEQHFSGRINTFLRPNPSVGDPSPRTIVQDGDSIWVGSFSGLERLRNGTWTRWTREHGLPGSGRVNAIIADRSGHFWMMTPGGLVRVSKAELDATPDDRPRRLVFAQVGSLDGVVPHPGNLRASPAATADRSGRLYFTTMDSIAVVDPEAVSDASMVPPIVLEAVTVDNEAVDHSTSKTFVEPSRLQFHFTSLNLRAPEHARFRYRLHGYDPDWIEAGTQRQVTYGTLRPGGYQFRVIGAGSEGVWNDTGASFAFQIVPVFWRTWWFQLSVGALGLSIAGALYRLRVRQLTRQFNVGLEARIGERTRIARELHDTVLQSFQGLMLRFQSARDLLPAHPEKAVEALDGALDRADQAIVEGRDAIQNLRSATTGSTELAEAITSMAEELTNGPEKGSATFRMSVEGSPKDLHPLVRDDIFRIAREALCNAFHHAQAGRVEAEVTYGARELRVRIRDDGTGIDPQHLESGRARHWGLTNMRERAQQIGSTLSLWSELGAGTEVELRTPGSIAYTASRRIGAVRRLFGHLGRRDSTDER